MRSQANRAAAPISANYLTRVLRDRYYLGVVTYRGEEYPGRHEPHVSHELFAPRSNRAGRTPRQD
jgi:hypothetical protein